jgi:hypothetical protein
VVNGSPAAAVNSAAATVRRVAAEKGKASAKAVMGKAFWTRGQRPHKGRRTGGQKKGKRTEKENARSSGRF